MKTKKLMLLCSLTIIALLGMNGCTASKSSGVANELTFSLNGITKLEISYDEEKVTFFTSDSDTLTVKEYMTVNNSRYYATDIFTSVKENVHFSKIVLSVILKFIYPLHTIKILLLPPQTEI